MKDRIFKDRSDAGRQLAAALLQQGFDKRSPLILGIPRGGVVVAEEVAQALQAPLDVIIARKVRAPHQSELGIGAIVDGQHICILNEELVRAAGATPDYLKREIAFQEQEIDRRLKFYRGDRPAYDVSMKTIIVVDDGIATGYTFRAALEGLRRRNPAKLVATAPVAASDSAHMLKSYADELICLSIPSSFWAVGAWYHDFEQVSDENVATILSRHYGRFESQGVVIP
jgi:predicted phosphoribosyltransferase